jgi:hypothetical protein
MPRHKKLGQCNNVEDDEVSSLQIKNEYMDMPEFRAVRKVAIYDDKDSDEDNFMSLVRLL